MDLNCVSKFPITVKYILINGSNSYDSQTYVSSQCYSENLIASLKNYEFVEHFKNCIQSYQFFLVYIETNV